MENDPRTLIEAVRYFSDPDRTLATMVALRWPDGVTCPTCGRADPRFIATRRMWECKNKHSRKQFSAKIGTIFEDSPLSLDKWFVAIWSVANCKNGISSHELHRAIGVTQKTAWFMLHRIRLAMQTGSFIMSGTAEADETYIGGLAANMHEAQRKRENRRGGGKSGDKAAVLGMIERTSEHRASRAKALVIQSPTSRAIVQFVGKHLEPGSEIMSDAAWGYRPLGRAYVHQVINHAVEYVRGNVHTNGIENFWSLLKRSIKGTYVSVEPFHLQRYVEEQTFRFNERKDDDGGRFRKVLRSVTGKRITYKALITHASHVS